MSFTTMTGKLAALLFVLAVPLALTFTGLRWMTLNASVYERGFVKYRVAAATGMSPAELSTATHQLIDYFADGRPITLQIRKDGQLAPLFDEREQAHLVDVRGLFQLASLLQAISVAYLALYTAVALALKRRDFLKLVAPKVLAGGVLTLVILFGLGLAATSDFGTFWPSLHLLLFNNDLWILDPRTDYMIRMFPEGFWFDFVLQLALMTAAAAVALAIAAFAYLRHSPR